MTEAQVAFESDYCKRPVKMRQADDIRSRDVRPVQFAFGGKEEGAFPIDHA